MKKVVMEYVSSADLLKQISKGESMPCSISFVKTDRVYIVKPRGTIFTNERKRNAKHK